MQLPSRANGALFLGALLLAAPASADTQATPAPRPIGKKDAFTLAAAQGPGVAVAAAPMVGLHDAASAAHAPLSLPPHVTFSLGQRHGDVGNGLEVSVQAIVDVPLRGIGSARADVAGWMLASTDLDLARAKQDAMLRAGMAWSRALEAKEVATLRSAALVEAKAIADVAKKRATGGVSDPLELSLAKADVGAAEAASLDAEGMVVDALAELRLSVGLPATAAIDPIGVLCDTKEGVVDEAAAILAAEQHDPTLRLAAARASSAKHEIALQHATLGPVLGVGGSWLRDGFGDQVWSAIVSVPLPFADPARFESARVKANADVAAAQLDVVREEVRKEVRVALHDRVHTREVRDKLRDEALAPLREALKLARAQYESGTRDVVLVLTIRQKLHTIEEQVAHSCGEVIRADMRLERRTGALGAAGG